MNFRRLLIRLFAEKADRIRILGEEATGGEITSHGGHNSMGIRTCNAHRVTNCPKCGG